MNKGDIVEFKSKIHSVKIGRTRKLRIDKLPFARKGIFLGYSYMFEGTSYDGGFIKKAVTIGQRKVAVISPLELGSRYKKEIKVLPEACKVITSDYRRQEAQNRVKEAYNAFEWGMLPDELQHELADFVEEAVNDITDSGYAADLVVAKVWDLLDPQTHTDAL